MGIDWFRMRPKQNAPLSELHRLIDLQARAFQRLPSMWATDRIEPYEIFDETETRRLERQYGDSSAALRGLLDFPKSDEAHTPQDFPELDVCWRVYPITRNSIFPVKWQVEAHRSYLPEELKEQLRKWKEWVFAVSRGCYRPFLLELYLYETTTCLNGLYRDISCVAQASLPKTTRWATRRDLVSIRDRILSFRVPVLYPAPIYPPSQIETALNLADHETFQSLEKSIHELVALTRSWDANVSKNWKIRYYEDYYMTFDRFLAQADDKWLHDFFAWAEACSSKGMGLFLDY